MAVAFAKHCKFTAEKNTWYKMCLYTVDHIALLRRLQTDVNYVVLLVWVKTFCVGSLFITATVVIGSVIV